MEKQTALDLFFETSLRHLYEGEKAISENLVVMAQHAATSRLRSLLTKHRAETKMQIQRLEKIFTLLEIDPKMSKIHGLIGAKQKAKELIKTVVDLNFGDRSKGIDGILSEGKELLRHFAETDANEFALISAAQKVEHYEIAAYNSLCLLAERYHTKLILDLLTESLNEEIRMEKNLTTYSHHRGHALAS